MLGRIREGIITDMNNRCLTAVPVSPPNSSHLASGAAARLARCTGTAPAGTPRSPGALLLRDGKRLPRFLAPCRSQQCPSQSIEEEEDDFSLSRCWAICPEHPALPRGMHGTFPTGLQQGGVAGLGGLFHCSGVQAVLCPGGKSLFLPSPLLPLLGI